MMRKLLLVKKVKPVIVGFIIAVGLMFIMGTQGYSAEVGRYQLFLLDDGSGMIMNDTATGIVKIVLTTKIGHQLGKPFEEMTVFPETKKTSNKHNFDIFDKLAEQSKKK